MAADLKTLQGLYSLDLLILNENDSLFIRYNDGTSLELSPCGSAFLHRQEAPRKFEMRQLTRFAVSSFRAKIIEAVRIRNLFAVRPYLCKELTFQQELQVGYHNITDCSWPDHSTAGFVTNLSDGSTCVTSLDGLASLTLMPHRQAFIARFLAEVKCSLQQKPRDKEKEIPQQKRYFVWQEQIHSLYCYPEAWKYPLQLVLDAVNVTEELATDPQCHNTKLPVSLPITCKAVHLHTWKAQVPGECSSVDWEILCQPNVKVIWKDGATYRIFRQSTGLFTVEIDPGDGSVMRSQTPGGKYYNHWFVQQNQHQGVEIQERVYSADKPLPDRFLRREYSVDRLIKQATRYTEFLTNAGQLQLEQPCCWKEASNSSATLSKPFYPALVVETAHVPGTGRFKAYSNGHISVVFSDRTILNLRQAADNKEHEAENSYCQLILANGTVQHFSLTDVEQCTMYQRYLQTARHWEEWVKATPSQRRTFYKDTTWDSEKWGAVSAEIEKIKRFNYIHNQQSIGNVAQDTQDSIKELDSGVECINLTGPSQERESVINSVLEQNNKAIDDIDGLLTMFKKCSSQNIY